MMRPVRHLLWTTVLVFVYSVVSSAQTPPAPSKPGPVAVSFTGGFATGASSTGGAVGGTFTFDVSDRLSIETTGAYLDRGRGVDSVYANAGLHVNLLPAGDPVVPYVAVGGGVYHVRYDLLHILGGIDQRRLEYGLDRLRGLGGLSHVPGMYADPMRGMIWPSPGDGWARGSFTDPAMTIGGGVRLDLTPHLSLRPDVRAVFAFADGRSSTLGLFTLNVGYRF
jgi:hypothetical protein